MRKPSLIPLAVFALMAGCRTSPVAAPTPPPYASLTQAGQADRLVGEMRTVGKALRAYSRDHNGRLPPRLNDLVAGGYLTAEALISSADPSGGREGGVPDAYSAWNQAAETDDPGSSYLYEFCQAPCKWDWKSYLGGQPGQSDVDADHNGVVSWAEAKSWQLLHGDTTQQPASGPYSLSRFPVVRCFWYQYPEIRDKPESRSVINLGADLETVFFSKPWWEKDP